VAASLYDDPNRVDARPLDILTFDISIAITSSFSCKGVVLFATEFRSSMILPPVVFAPTAVTSILAFPSVTNEPANSKGLLLSLVKGSLSPVRADSSMTIGLPSSHRPSAGTSSPVVYNINQSHHTIVA